MEIPYIPSGGWLVNKIAGTVIFVFGIIAVIAAFK